MANKKNRSTINNNIRYSRTKQINNYGGNFVSNKMLVNLNELTSEVLNYNGKMSEYNSELYKTTTNDIKILQKQNSTTESKIIIDTVNLIKIYKQTYTTLDINNAILEYLDDNYIKMKDELNALKNKFTINAVNITMTKLESFLYFQISVDEKLAWYKILKLINSKFDSINSAINVMNSFDDSKSTLIKFMKYLDI